MIYDFQTKNESFIEMAYQLKQEGRKNWKFFLLLLDEDLVGVNPYDPNLSDAMKFKIQKEVINNYWYYIREVIKIPEAGGYTTYRLNKLNLAISYCMSMNLNCFIEGPRQSGKTVGINIRYTWIDLVPSKSNLSRKSL